MPSLEDRLLTVDQTTAYLGLQADKRIHWRLGNIAAAEWAKAGNTAHHELREKTTAGAVGAPHMKRVYPFGFIVPLVAQHIELARSQLDLFGDENDIGNTVT